MASRPEHPDGAPGRARQPDIDAILPRVYQELRDVASAYLRRERPGHTLQPTALVHEAYMRMAQAGTIPSTNQRQFLAVAARAIRQVLVDHARGKHALKRGGEWQRITLDHDLTPSEEPGLDVLALHDALERLATVSARQAQVVEMRFFAGMTDEQVGETLDISPRTARGDWQVARAWLRRELERA